MRLALTVAYLAAAATSVVAALLILRRRAMSAATWLALTILAAGFWALCDALELQAVTVGGKRVVSQLQYLGVVSAAPFYAHAAAALARFDTRMRGGVLLLVWAIPLVTLAAAWTSQWHTWLWRSVTIPDPASNLGVYEYGGWFWIFMTHAYLLLAAASVVLLLATTRVRPAFRAPFSAVLVAVLLPWIGNAAYVFKVLPVPGLNPLSISILASACIFAWATARGGLLDLLPQAREALVAGMQDAVILSDLNARIVYANAAARRIVGDARLASLPGWLADAVASGGNDARHGTSDVVVAGETRSFDVRVDTVNDRWNETAGSVFVLRDITQRRAMEAEREKLIAELEHALGTVRTLEGILAVCSGCRRIREDDGSWSPLDRYVRRHAGVDFSHGVCPDCARRLYGEFAD